MSSESIDLAPNRIEPEKTTDIPEHVKDPIIASSQSEIAVGKTVSDANPLEQENHSDLFTALVVGRILTNNGSHTGNDKITIYSPSLNKRYHTKSDATGHFQIDQVSAADDYQLQISPQGMYQRYSEKISVSSPLSQFYIQLKPMPLNTLRGQVFNIENIPVTNFSLRVRSREILKWKKLFTTDSIGRFELDNVPVGNLTFTSMQDQVLSTIVGYELQNNQHQALNLIVDEGPYAISGLVFDQYGAPAVGANVLLSWKYREGKIRTTVSRRTATGQDGYFYLQGIGPGRHELVVADISSGTSYKEVLNFSYDYTDIAIYLK